MIEIYIAGLVHAEAQRRLAAFKKGGRQVGTYYERPRVKWGDIWCKRCGKACDFEDSAAHNARDPGRSRLYIQVKCHGETANILMTFKEWGDNQGKRIDAFLDCALPEKQVEAYIRPPTAVITHPFLLMDRTFD